MDLESTWSGMLDSVQVIDTCQTIADIPEWFHGSRLNYAENILRHRDDRVAVYGLSELDKFIMDILKIKFHNFRKYDFNKCYELYLELLKILVDANATVVRFRNQDHVVLLQSWWHCIEQG